MSEQTDPELRGSAERRASSPYEGALHIAFKKLTEEIFIFLLAYMILLIGIAIFGSGIETELRSLLYLIPILGVVAYVWLKKRNIVKDARERDLQVRSGIARGDANVTGVRGPYEGTVRVDSGWASGRAGVTGADYGSPSGAGTEASQPVNAQYLVDIFEQLNGRNQRRLIGSAQGMLDEQEEPNA